MKHVIVIGAGLIGAAAAYSLGRSGCRVTMIDAAGAGGLASRASFGWLNASFHLDVPHFHLRHAAMQAHVALSQEVPGFHDWSGCLWFEETGPQAQSFAEGLAHLGYPTARIDASSIRARWPLLTGVDEAVFLPGEGAVETPGLAMALCQRSGAEVWFGPRVRALIERGGRIIGVETGEGRVQADAVVLCAGVGTPDLIAGLGLRLPMLPRPGAMVVTRPTARITDTLLCGPMGEMRQTREGRILLPTSPGHQGDTAEALTQTPGDLARAALDRVRLFFPGLALEVEQILTAARPVPADGLPVLSNPLPGLIVAVMHSGATLAPLAGQAVADLVTNGHCDPVWDRHSLDRFQK